MKINKNDIDSAIIEKVNQFDELIENFSDEDRSGFLAYNGEKFYIRRTSDVFLRKISSEEELERLKAHLYSEEGLLKNSFSTKMSVSDLASPRFKQLAINAVEEELFKFTSRVILHKEHKGSIYAFTEKGFLIQFDTNEKKSDVRVDIIGGIRSNFAIRELSAYDFLAIEIFDGGAMLSTRNDGVFMYDFEKKTIELKFPESDVVLIKDLGDGTFVLGMDRIDNNIAFYNISGMRIEISNNLRKRSFQMPHLAVSRGDSMFILGRPYSLRTTKDTLHHWRKDLAGISYNGNDGSVFPGYDHKNYNQQYLDITDTHLYISGLKDDGKLFVWQYDLNELQKPFREFSFDKFSFDRLSFVEMNEEHFVAAESKKVYFIDSEGNVTSNLILNDEIRGVFNLSDKGFVYLSDDKIVSVTVPSKVDGDITLRIYEGENACNNIDIFVSSSTGKERIAFFDEETLEQLAPFYFGVYKTDIIIKILGSTAKKISMRISIPSDSSVEGVVVSPNRLFMK